MATPRFQRIGILVIALVLSFGTIGSFLAVILSMGNQKNDQAKAEIAFQEYQEATQKQANELSDKYYEEFSKYADRPTAFDGSNIIEVVKNDLKVGDGEEIKDGFEYSAYYIGWNPEGVVFDQSIEVDSLRSPISGQGLIEGWTEGAEGMKLGGVREITIPSDKAYGEAGSGENIPPNTPLKFIVMAIPKVEDIPMPQVMIDYYRTMQGQ